MVESILSIMKVNSAHSYYNDRNYAGNTDTIDLK